MGIRIDPNPPKGDAKAAAAKVAEAIWSAVKQDYGKAAKSVYGAVTAFRSTEETNEQRAWTLWRESLAYALRDFFETANLTRRPDDLEEFQRILEGILSRTADIALSSDQVRLEQQHLKKPTDFPLYGALREALPGLINHIAPDHGQNPDDLRRRMDRSFTRRFPAAWTAGWSQFQVLEEALGGAAGEAARRADEWQRYHNWLARSVETEPLFGHQAGGPTLADIFVPLRCYWRKEPPKQRDYWEDDEAERSTIAHVSWLAEEIRDWLIACDKDDLLRIIAGGPGSGKSSSARMIARDLSMTGRCNVLLVPLQGLDVTAPPHDIVEHYIQATRTSSEGLSENPMNWLREDYMPLLLIFDGLDEVARPDGAGAEVTRKFVANLRTWLWHANELAPMAKVVALVLGRQQAAENAADEISLRDRALLHVAQLCPLEERLMKRGHDHHLTVGDPGGLCEIEQRSGFWKNYAAVAQDCPADPPAALFEDTLRELTVEPLLLYLLIFSGYVSEKWQDAAENRNRVYEGIFRKVQERDAEDKPSLSVRGYRDEDDFFTLMECLGLAAWRGGGKTGTTAHFDTLRDRIYAPEKRTHFAELANANLDNVALQFYTHRSHRDEPGYAFVHKSFGEYLTARALVEAGNKWLNRHRGLPESFAVDWLRLTGPQGITDEILHFMREEARLRIKRTTESQANLQVARKRIGRLCAIAAHTLREGFPAHHEIEIEGGSNWRRREQAQRNAEEALYALIYVWGEAGFPGGHFKNDSEDGRWSAGAIAIDWPDDQAAGNLFLRLLGQRALRDAPITTRLFARFDLAGAVLVSADLREANLRGADLKGADLIGANLFGADLCGADLCGARVSEADLNRTNLRESDLRGANLSGSSLNGADLRQAYLSRAVLSRTNLSVANLREAKLSGANLDGADLSAARVSSTDLRGANLNRANLRGANLSRANLCGANLSGALLIKAHLEDVDFTNAKGLTQGQVDSANGNARTNLPEGLNRPAHWEEEDASPEDETP